MEPTRIYIGQYGEITSFPSILRGVLRENGVIDYGALYVQPDYRERRAELDASDGYWSHR